MSEKNPKRESPAARLLDRRIVAVDRSAGTAEVSFGAKPEFANRSGNVQGGMLAAMLDSALGVTLGATLQAGESIVTLEMKVSYLKPASCGRIGGFGRIVDRGRAIAFLEGELRDVDGAVVARATATFRVLRERSPGEKE